MLVRLVGIAALAAAGLVIAYDLGNGPSYSDGPMSSVRDALACDGRVHATRQTAPGDRAMWEPAPEAALQSGLLQSEQWWVQPDAVRVSARTGQRVLFVHDVEGRARFAGLVERGTGGRDGEWRLSAWSICDPGELVGARSESLGYGAWLDADGDPVPTTRVMTWRGAERCGWKDVTFIDLDGGSAASVQLVNDPSGSLDGRLRTTYDARAQLPADARDTGWRRGGSALWLQPDGDAAYLVNVADPTDVQRWPEAKRPIACDEAG